MAAPAIIDNTHLNQINEQRPRQHQASKKTRDTKDPPDNTKNTLKNSERKVDQFKQQRQTVSDKTGYTLLKNEIWVGPRNENMNINPRVPRKTGTRPQVTRTKRKILDITTVTKDRSGENYRKNRTEYRRWGPEIELTLGYARNVNTEKITLKSYTKEVSRVNRNKYQRSDNKFRADGSTTR